VFLALLLATGLASLVAMLRSGIRMFWSGAGRAPARIRVAEGLPVVALLAACLGLTVTAGPVTRFALETARGLHAPRDHVRGVLGAGVAAPPRARTTR
jgi:multicomponent K+:H+ antiporter subunit D